MTKLEWAASSDPRPMLRAMKDRVDDRSLRAFALASCRLVWDRLSDERSRTALAVAERFMRGAATADDLVEAQRTAAAAHEDLYSQGGNDYDMDTEFRKRCDAAQAVIDVVDQRAWIAAWNVAMLLDWERPRMAQLLRELVSEESLGSPDVVHD
jgi:hypothetical protein